MQSNKHLLLGDFHFACQLADRSNKPLRCPGALDNTPMLENGVVAWGKVLRMKEITLDVNGVTNVTVLAT